jgi:hypothetical protein
MIYSLIILIILIYNLNILYYEHAIKDILIIPYLKNFNNILLPYIIIRQQMIYFRLLSIIRKKLLLSIQHSFFMNTTLQKILSFSFKFVI